ncbi:hypothetical protein A2291_02865 [candidate division WOR-1 bacterium RIFOXYB2_FULL_42_35]|uniref:UPF0182 protein A2462_06010 n=1 Tax=candidate division WOR-1 bacterium RIFOXYC2_FULL_41_25 TaxID=1802586 RepID=A0A1F4TQT7_UNCSA|nr:MAG: hypothetical protein A2247_01175 [candidate division WOR-1 bacterium RIFOXYA2_FULL_41_14]OGC25692.1 MAG: hypothetical protein A2291_02865 [candidate division WOR-1 bacterium RIFOXYB2_FULL_42_35]OGC35094.1 MAG: hypothetical protein A2462_06010 [candidate division WOR-1 bacterium RIFOXYC2_FULL_41_25]
MRRFPLAITIILVFIVWSLISALISIYPNFLWLQNLGFSAIFWINLKAKVLTGLAFGLLFLVIAAVNIYVANRLTKGLKKNGVRRKSPDIQKMIEQLFGEGGGANDNDDDQIIDVGPQPEGHDRANLFWLLGILVVALFMGLSALTQWQVVLKALNASSFGIADPIFNKDIGFYVFQFPLLKFIQGFIMSALMISGLAALWIYFTKNGFSLEQVEVSFARGVKAHLALLLALLTGVFAWGLWLGRLEILYSARGIVFGAGYTDVNAQLLGYNLQILVLFVLSALFLINIFQKDYKLPLVGAATYLVVAVVMGGIYPAFIQNLQVKPNEISMESPYIANGIKFTRQAYGLDNIEEKEFAAEQDLSLADLRRNTQTISNIRLWDPRPIKKTYNQLQGIRLYYDFADVDVDRYQINGKYQEVMLSPRELKISKLPAKAQNWVNQHLSFTHGYGVCLSPVNEKTSDGLPNLLVKDIPPVSSTDLKIERPEIYYGEESDNYVFVKTKEKEFDYPKGDSNVYSTYQGKGGVQISSFLRRLAFAINFSDLKILLTDYITKDSRIMFNRSIAGRVKTIAPFLSYDSDPYLVISKGQLYWIQDAYTTSNLYPYSDPTGTSYARFNYIRNSVKAVVNAYDGSVDFYIIDAADPLAKTYQKIYPGLFKSFAQMPEDLKKHLRYPYDLFMIQAHKYATFHMDEPQVYYNQEDLWNIPKEIYAGNEQLMEAYYIIMRLPKEKREEFLLMLPFTPNNKDNMIAWLAGRSDMPNYGKLIVYKFPKDKLVYGPMQVEARIDQQTEISQQFTLWGQGGSRVIRGNLLAIPIKNSIVYVEPVYLEASSGELPQLKRIIVVYGNNVAMGESLDSAFSQVFSGRVRSSVKLEEKTESYLNPKELAQKALNVFDQAQSNLKQGNFGSYGEKLNELKKLLQDLAK